MLFDPAIMALILVSVVSTSMLVVAASFALGLLRHWNIHSGSERQLVLERRTYLISTLLTWVFASELVSLLLFIYNAEAMSGQFVGAMCATGVLNVNPWGWPTLFLKIAVFFSGAAWLSLNRLDNQGYDYPLIRQKYLLLLLILPLVVAELVVQWLFFNGMNPNVITSCCGTLFSADAEGVAAEVSALSPRIALIGLVGSGGLVFVTGLAYARTGRGGVVFGLASVLALLASLVTIVSFVALYVYEHPHHHCPFCILKKGHGYAGYWLYIPLFLGSALGLATAVQGPWRQIPSLSRAAARDRSLFTGLSLFFFAVFYLVSAWLVFDSNLTMQGVWW